MKQPFFWIALGFTAGILAGGLAFIPDHYFWVSFLAGFPLLWAMRGGRLFLPVCLLLAAALGGLYARAEGVRAGNAVENFAADINDPRWTELEGRVLTAPEVRERGRRRIVPFILEARQMSRRNSAGRHELIQIEGQVQIFAFNPDVLPEVGDYVRLRGKLERPRQALNPGEFNYAAYLAQKNIFALLNAYGRGSIRILKPGAAWSPLRLTETMRRGLAARIDTLYAHEPEAAIFFKALIIGTTRQIPTGQREDFVKTGTAHVNPT